MMGMMGDDGVGHRGGDGGDVGKMQRKRGVRCSVWLVMYGSEVP